MEITYHNNDVRNKIDISNSVIILSLEPHKFDSRRAFIIAIHENGRRFANTVWIKDIPEGKKTWKINTNSVTDLQFDGIGVIGDDVWVEIYPDTGWDLWKRSEPFNPVIDGKHFKYHANQAYRDSYVFHQDNKYAYAVYFTNPKKSNRPFVIKMKNTGTGVIDPFEISGGKIIRLADLGWRSVGNIGPRLFKSQSNDFKNGLVEILSDTSIWDSTDRQYQEAIKFLKSEVA